MEVNTEYTQKSSTLEFQLKPKKSHIDLL